MAHDSPMLVNVSQWLVSLTVEDNPKVEKPSNQQYYKYYRGLNNDQY